MKSDKNFSNGFNRIYDISLALGLRKLLRLHSAAFEGHDHVDLEGGLKCWSIRAFDDAITRRTFNWPSVDAYYAGKHHLSKPINLLLLDFGYKQMHAKPFSIWVCIAMKSPHTLHRLYGIQVKFCEVA